MNRGKISRYRPETPGTFGVQITYDLARKLTWKFAIPRDPAVLEGIEHRIQNGFEHHIRIWERNRYERFPFDTTDDQKEVIKAIKEAFNGH